MTDVSIVTPTYNEQENIPVLAERVFNSLEKAGVDGELIVVDDNSPDGTGQVAEELKGKYKVKVVHRKGKEGLSSAVLAGFKAAESPVLAVIDADLSHPPEVLPGMLKRIQEGKAELVFASRNIPGGGVEGWPLIRKLTSRGATLLARPVTSATDPMSGYFMLKKEVIDGVELNPRGFKIGLEILVKGKYKGYGEVPIMFIDRQAGESKLNTKEYINYVLHLFDLMKYKLRSLLGR